MEIDSVIFDMDGVLVNVSQSYRQAIKETVNFFLAENEIDMKTSQEEIDTIKNLAGFNNDWDATFVLIKLLTQGVKTEDFGKEALPPEVSIRKTTEYKRVKDIFQTFYLGSRLFEKTEKRKTPINGVTGCILKEKCLVSKELLEQLANMDLKLGIATSRPRQEALFAINKFKLQKHFPQKFIVAQEDTTKEKPNPGPLLEAKKRMNVQNPVYIGDSINDIIAAEQANMVSIFVGKNELGDIQIKTVNQLMKVLA